MTVTFESVQRQVAMLAEALLARPIRLDVDERQPLHGRRPMQLIPAAPAIVLPAEVDAFGNDEHDRRLLRHAVVHQAAYELFGTLTFDVARFLAAHPDRPMLGAMFAAIEERRIDACVRVSFPGVAADIERARSFDERLAGPIAAVVAAIDSRADLHSWSVDDVAAVALVCCPVRDPAEDEDAQWVEPVDLESEELELPSEPDGPPAPRVRGAGDDAGDDAGDLDALIDVALGFAADVETLPALVAAEGAGAGSELPQDSPARGPIVERRTLSPAAGRRDDLRGSAAPEGRSFLYDEWDAANDRYLRSWCRVHERPLQDGDVAFIADVRRRYASLARDVRRTFSRIAAESWSRVHGERDGAELDLDEVVSALVNLRNGIIDDEHLYIRQVRTSREVAAAFLLDMSASTSSPVIDPTAPPPPPTAEPDHLLYRSMPLFEDEEDPRGPPPRRVLDLAKESLALMCDALQVLGDDHAIYGFSGEGRDGVEFYVAKELGESPSSRTWARLAAMEPRRYTRMGPAIRHAAWKLGRHSARTRLLVVVSDGYPQDRDYGPDRGDRSHGIADTAKAIEEAERAGVRTFCITVDPAGHDYLREMCADDRYAVIADVMSLPDELARVYGSLATGLR